MNAATPTTAASRMLDPHWLVEDEDGAPLPDAVQSLIRSLIREARAEVRADLIERVEGLVPTALHVACQPTEPCVVPVGVITAVDAAIRAAFLQDDKENR